MNRHYRPLCVMVAQHQQRVPGCHEYSLNVVSCAECKNAPIGGSFPLKLYFKARFDAYEVM